MVVIIKNVEGIYSIWNGNGWKVICEWDWNQVVTYLNISDSLRKAFKIWWSQKRIKLELTRKMLIFFFPQNVIVAWISRQSLRSSSSQQYPHILISPFSTKQACDWHKQNDGIHTASLPPHTPLLPLLALLPLPSFRSSLLLRCRTHKTQIECMLEISVTRWEAINRPQHLGENRANRTARCKPGGRYA